MPVKAPKPKLQSEPGGAAWKQTQAGYLHGRSFVDGADALAHELEAKWGVGRLRLLVDNDLRSRFDAQRLKFNTAIWDSELDDMEREATRMANAWRALDKAATDAGKKPTSPRVWEIARPDGKVIALVQDMADATLVRPEGRHVDVYTIEEIGNLIASLPDMIRKARQTWPGDKIVRIKPIRDPLNEFVGDEIPF